MKFFQRFQSGLIADVISSLLWTLVEDQQCANKLLEKCAPFCDALVEAKEVQISHIIARQDNERFVLLGMIVVFLLGCVFGWCLHCGLLAQQQCRWTGPRRC